MENKQIESIIIQKLQEYDTDELISLYNSYIKYQIERYEYISPMADFRSEFSGFSAKYLFRLGQNSPDFNFNDDYYTMERDYQGERLISFTEDEINEYFVDLIPEIARYAVDHNVYYQDENIYDILLDYGKVQ